MKKLKDQINAFPSAIFSGLVIFFSVAISGVLIYFIALPNFQSLSQLNTEINAEKVKAASIDKSIINLKSQDKEVLAALEKFLQTYVPGTVDNLHFATLNEAVSKAAGVTVTNIQISSGKGAKTDTAAPASTTEAASGTKQSQTNQTAAVQIAVTYNSNFDSLLRLINYWKLADQLIGVKSLDISGVTDEFINYTIYYDLPTSPAVAKAVVEDNLVFTKEQAKKLQELKNNILYTATPSSQSVGKSDPFK